MQRLRSVLLSVGILAMTGTVIWPGGVEAQGCQLAPVFQMLRDLIGRDRMGECTTAVVRNDAGDFNQPTTRGILTFRPSDLVAAFSDGQTTWLYGPNGLESRPTGARLPWEGTGLPIANSPAPAAPPAPAAQAASSAAQAASNAPASFAPASPPTPTVVVLSGLPIKLDGDESATTKQFDLTGGDYVIGWEIQRERGKASCYVGSRLRRADDLNPGALVLHTTLNTANDRTASGEARIFSVLPGRYVFDVETMGCQWKLTINAAT